MPRFDVTVYSTVKFNAEIQAETRHDAIKKAIKSIRDDTGLDIEIQDTEANEMPDAYPEERRRYFEELGAQVKRDRERREMNDSRVTSPMG